MIKNKVKIIGIIFITLITINSCEKDNTISENDLSQKSNIEQKSNEEFPYNIINLSSFDFDAFVEGEEVDFDETVTDDNGKCYGIKITTNKSTIDAWVAQEQAAGKETYVYEYGESQYDPITHKSTYVVLLYIGISWEED